MRAYTYAWNLSNGYKASELVLSTAIYMQLRKHILFPLLTKQNKPIALAHVVLILLNHNRKQTRSHLRGQSSNVIFLLLVACPESKR